MEDHMAVRSFTIMPLAVMFVILVGGVAASLLFAKRGKTPIPIIVLFVVLGLTAVAGVFGAFGIVTARRVVTHEAEHRHLPDLDALSAEIHTIPVTEGMRAVDRVSLPVEAARPRARVAAVASLPEWVSTPVSAEGDRKLVVVQSEQFADPTTAATQAIQEATELVLRDFDHFHHRAHSLWHLDPLTVRSAAVRRTFTEPIERSAGEHDFTVYRTYLLVELSPEVRRQIEPIWRKQVSEVRSATVVALLAVLTSIVAVIAGFFRLDDRTSGKYRWPLGLATVAVAVLLASVPVFGTLRWMQVGPPSIPPTPVPAPVEIAPQV
jgi:hypothetical protein